MTTTLEYETDPALAAARTQVDALRTRRAAIAKKLRELWPGGWGTPRPSSIRLLQTEEDLVDAERAVIAAEATATEADQQARERIIKARRPGHNTLVRALLAAIEAAVAAARKLEAHDAETAHAVGYAEPMVPEVPVLLAMAERLHADAAPKAEPAAPLLKPGRVRIKYLAACRGTDALSYFYAGDVSDVTEAIAKDLIDRGIAAAA